ncbi:MAG: hypothetical protein EPO40_29070 [Myxococcaceae bacterium]|nr:MAG: hypothetical protein EPO40_29070 [Myxococcaceae bacterium]
MNQRSCFVALAVALVPAAAPAINLSPSLPDAEPGTLEMGTMRAAWTDTTVLLFGVTPVRSSGLGALTVQAYDPSGAPVPRSFRGVPAIGLIDYHSSTGQSYQVASYGSGVMAVAVTSLNGIVAARVQPSGVSVDRAPVVLRPPGSPIFEVTNNLGLACTPSTCLTVYGQMPGADPNSSVAAQRVGTDGRLLDAAPLALGRYGGATPVVVALADRFIVAWTTELTGSPRNVVAARVMADGRVLDPGGRALTTAGAARLNVRIAPDGSPGARVSLGTWRLDAPPIAPTASRFLLSDVVFDGINFVVAWGGYPETSLRAARVSPAGVVLDTTPLTIVAGDDTQPVFAPMPVMASDGRGTTAFVYSAFDPDLAGERVRAAFLHGDGGAIADVGAPPVDAGAPLDVPLDVGVVPVADASSADVASVADAAAADLGTGGGRPPDDGAICDVGGTPGRTTHRGFVVLAALGLALARRRSGLRRDTLG